MTEKNGIETEWVEIDLADGTKMATFIARPQGAGETAPGLLVLQEAFGVNAHIRDLASRFAAEGYVVASPELFHRSAPKHWEGSYDDTTFASIRPHFEAMKPETLAADLRATYEWLTAKGRCDRTRVGSIGYCLGGRATFIANALLPLKAAVSYYGSSMPLEQAPSQHGPILFFWGGKDQHIGPDQRRAVNDAMTKAGKTFVDVEFSAADHGFFNDQRKAYEPVSAKQSWALATTFLRDHLGKR